MDAPTSLHAALKFYQSQASEQIDENCLKLVPEKVKNFFISYMKQVQATNNILYCLSNTLEANKSLLPSHSLLNRLNLLKANFKSDMERLTNDLMSELGTNTPLNISDDADSSFLKYKFTSQPVKTETRTIELFESSDEDTELGNMVDQIVTGKLCNSEKRKMGDNSDPKRCKVDLTSDGLPESGANKLNRNLRFDNNGFLEVYIDGACSHNGRAGAQAGYGVWFNYNHSLNVAEPVQGPPTNNNAEIQAATRAILRAQSIGVRKIKIMTDSQFLINCMTQWIRNWKKNNWMTAGGKEKVRNEASLKELDDVVQLMDQVKWEYVEAHKGIEGNEQADALAKKGASMYRN